MSTPAIRNCLGLLNQAREYRRNRNDRILDNLSEIADFDLSRADIPSPREVLGRPHITKYLVETGIVSSIQAAFDDCLATGAECCVPMERVDYDTAIHAIQRAGGVTSLAYPGRITFDNITIDTMVDQLTGVGIGTIELKYPCEGVMRVSTTILRSLARRKWPHLTICCERVDLIATVPTPESSELGALVFPDSSLTAL